jgi:hypothetical protein
MNHKAIYKLYPTVVSIDDGAGALNADGNQVQIDMSLIDSWVDPELYKQLRCNEYPSMVDQLDMQYWDKINGTDTWQEAIQAVKDKYPKP